MQPTLLIESVETQHVQLLEGKSDKGLTKFQAVVSKVNFLNRNGRVYPTAVMERELPKLVQERNRSDRIGMVDHPDRAPKLEDLGIRWLSFRVVGNDVLGEGEFLSTPRGQYLEMLARDGVEFGFSSRGSGTFTAGEFEGQDAAIINDDYQLFTFDAVVQPSVADARIAAYEHVLERFEAMLQTNPEALDAVVERVLSDAAVTEGDDAVLEYDADEEDLAEAKWTTKYKDSLPDDAFLDPKNRRFPYKNKDGQVDLPHLRNAAARIAQSTAYSDEEKQALLNKAQGILRQYGGDKKEGEAVEQPTTETPEASADSAQAQESQEQTDEATETPSEDAPAAQEGAPEVNPLQERVDSLEATLTERDTALATALQEKAALEASIQALNEDAASLSALLMAIATALSAELADQDWDDAALLANFAQCVSCRRGDEAAAEVAGSKDAADDDADEAAKPQPTAVEALQTAVPTLLKEYREAKVKAHIAKITRHEKWGRAIAQALEDSAHSIEEADQMLSDVRDLVTLKMNAAAQTATQGAVEDAHPRWTQEQLRQRRLAGIFD